MSSISGFLLISFWSLPEPPQNAMLSAETGKPGAAKSDGEIEHSSETHRIAKDAQIRESILTSCPDPERDVSSRYDTFPPKN